MSPLSGAFLEKKHDITWVIKLDLEENEKERQKKNKEEGSDRYSLSDLPT